jgi:iron(III) transport system ATP-binding protein
MLRTAAVRLEKAGRAFGANIAVKDVSIDVSSGEVVSLVGHSGCGKSTLLRIIAGVETLDRGSVSLGGKTVDGGGRFVEPEHRNVGFVFQDYALFPHLSVRDNILFGLKKRPRRAAVAAVWDLMERIGIRHLEKRFPHELSGGEQQRVALARALAPKPAVVLLDEPFSNLDQGMRHHVRDETLSVLRSTETTVVMVTHDPEEALSSGDRVVLMRAGEIIQSGTPREIYSRPNSVYTAEFFCAFNKIPGRWQEGLFVTAIGKFTFLHAEQQRDAQMLFIRPQAVRVSPTDGDYSARIEERAFLGASERLRLRVQGLDSPLTAVITSPLPQDAVMVRVSIASDALMAF